MARFSIYTIIHTLPLSDIYTYDFGHGTTCISLDNPMGGLSLEIIYFNETNEIICGQVITNKLADVSKQKEFIKAIAPFLCPASDKKAVSDWVNSNVGGEAAIDIGGLNYSLELGPVKNCLYYAGYANWEDWDLTVN